MSVLTSALDSFTWPMPAFHFNVVFTGMLTIPNDYSFQDVSGIGSQIETEDIMQGGDNLTVIHLPKGVKHSNLVLKRGIFMRGSGLVEWCINTFSEEFDQISPQGILVSLLDEYGIPQRMWSFDNAYPVNWKVDSFNSTKNEVAIEEIELCYSNMTRTL